MPGATLLLICCAATDSLRAARFPLDEPLDAGGLAATAALAGSIRRADRAWSSPAARARQTAQALGLVAADESALRDLDCGTWAGRGLDELGQTDPGGVGRWLADPGAAPHGGESVAGLIGRVEGWLGSVPDGRTVAVSHPAVLRGAVVCCLRAPADAFWRIDVAPLCLVRLRRAGERWTLQGIGRLRAPDRSRAVSDARP